MKHSKITPISELGNTCTPYTLWGYADKQIPINGIPLNAHFERGVAKFRYMPFLPPVTKPYVDMYRIYGISNKCIPKTLKLDLLKKFIIPLSKINGVKITNERLSD